MEELIRIHEKGDKQVIDCRELYSFLGYDKSQWSRWYKKNIEEDDFFEELVDYTTFDIVSKGNFTKNFHISIDMAKEICMLARNEKGKQARRYFIACENKLREVSQLGIPKTFSEALRLAADQAETIENQKKELEFNKPKVELYDKVMDSNSSYLVRDIAKLLGFKNIGQNKLFAILKKQGVLMYNNRPYQKYVNSGHFVLKMGNYSRGGKNVAYCTTRVTPKGMELVKKIVESYLASLEIS